jgi:CheY-like chemotaxis protein
MPKVMLVEDDVLTRQLLGTLLEMEGYQVLSSQGSNRAEIVDSICIEQPQAVLMDIRLENCSGVDILRDLRNGYRQNHIKVLMTSGEDMSAACLQAGADGFLQKPYMPDELLAWLREFVH